MDILFKTKKLEKSCNDFNRMQREYGAKIAKLLHQRLDDLKAIKNLEVMRMLPGGCHKLKGDRKVQFGINLTRNYRLVFESCESTSLNSYDGDWSQIIAIEIIEITDYH